MTGPAETARTFRTEGGGVLRLLDSEITPEYASLIRSRDLVEVQPSRETHGETDSSGLAAGLADTGETASETGETVSVLPMPALTDDKGAWIAYAVAQGMTQGKAEGMSRARLHAHFTGQTAGT